MNCHSCQLALPAEANFCPQCGAAQSRAIAPKAEAAGDRRVVTVLFADVSGFTTISEQLDPEAVTEIVNDFFGVLTEPIYRYGGVVDKYIGDAIMALFGAPIAHEDDPERAVHAAYEMQQVARTFSSELEGRTGISLKVRIGLNTGLVVAGSVGGEQKRDYTVMGDTVNLAQRMEAAARPGRVLVTQETYQSTAHSMEYLSLDPLVIKGKLEPVLIYELVGPRSERSNLPGEFRLCGRQLELSTLQDCLRRSLNGIPQLIYLIGEAGIGKSELSSALFSGLAVELGVEGQRVRALSYEQDVPYALVRNFVQRWLSAQSLENPREVYEALSRRGAWPESYGADDRTRDAVAIAYLIGLELATPAFDQLSPQQRRTAAFHALNVAVLSATKQRPLLLNLEDLHWADEASVGWLRSLVDLLASREFQTARITILCQARTAEGNMFGSWRSAIDTHTLRLRPFSESESLAFAAGVLELDPDETTWDEPLRNALDQVLARAEGNPLFLRELLRTLVDSAVLVQKVDRGWVVTGPVIGKLPTTINGVILARLDRLSGLHRTVLQVAAVIGRSFQADLLASVGGFASPEASLEALAHAGFIQRRANGEWLFQHALIHEVVYTSLLLSSRRDLHRKVGEMLEARLGSQAREAPQLLARHFQHGEVPAKALQYGYWSGEMAHHAYANQEALNCFTECLQLLAKSEALPLGPSEVDVRLAIADILVTTGQYVSAMDHLKAGLDLQGNPQQRAETLRRIGGVLNLQGQYQEAMNHFEQGLALLRESGDERTRARILNDQGLTLFRQGQFGEVSELCRRSLEVLEGTACTKELAMVLSLMGIVSYRQGQIKESERYHRRAHELREQLEDTFGIASSLNNLGVLYLEQGEWQKATEYYDRSLKIYQRIGDVSRQIIQLNNLGDLLRNQGELEEAELLHQLALELSLQSQDTLGAGIAASGVGIAQFSAGRNPEAIAYLQQGISSLQEINAVEVLPEPLAMMTQALACEARFEEAALTLERARTLARANESRVQLGMALCAEAVLFECMQDPARAADAVFKALTELGVEAPPIERARALSIAARLHDRLEKPQDARACRIEASEIFRRLGAKHDLAALESPISVP